jgi:hypothetical protein
MKTGMGASYVGYNSKTFHASSLDGSYRFKSTDATFQNIVRENDNMAGKDVDFEQVIPHISSPVKFTHQKDRDAFTKYGVFGQNPCNENRFTINKNEYNTINTKYGSLTRQISVNGQNIQLISITKIIPPLLLRLQITLIIFQNTNLQLATRSF